MTCRKGKEHHGKKVIFIVSGIFFTSSLHFTSHHFTTHINFSHIVSFLPRSLHCASFHFTTSLLFTTSLHFTSLISSENILEIQLKISVVFYEILFFWGFGATWTTEKTPMVVMWRQIACANMKCSIVWIVGGLMQMKLLMNVITANILNQELLFVKVNVFWTAIISLPFRFLYWLSSVNVLDTPGRVKVKVKVTLEQATKSQRRSRSIALLFL